MNRRTLGTRYETLAAEYLERLGYRILCRNYRCKKGEIDLIATEKDCLVFVEVKYRSSAADGYAAEAVDARKQRRITQAASWYLMEQRAAESQPCRFDVVAFDGEMVQLIRDAFWTEPDRLHRRF